MSYNGSGTFLINSAGQPVVAGTTITASAFNTLTADLATGLTNALCKDGQSTPTANISLGNYKITNLAAGTLVSDAARLSQVQSGATIYLTSVSGTDTIVGTATPNLSAYAAGNIFNFVAAGTNTGATTININGLGAKSITKNGTTALAAGDITINIAYQIIYDGTRFQLQSSQIISLGTNVATWLATPSSANLAAAVTDETGTGALVFANTPTLVTPALGAATATTLTSSGIITANGGINIATPLTTPTTTEGGYMGTPVVTQDSTYTFVLADRGKTYYHTSVTAHSYTIPANGTVAFPIGTIIAIENENGAGNLTLSITTDTLRWSASTGSRTIAANGSAAVKKVASTVWRLVGNGIT